MAPGGSISANPNVPRPKSHLLRLSIGLWDWDICDDCRNGRSCAVYDCPARRLGILSRYYAYYNDIIKAYELDIGHNEELVFRSQDDVLRGIASLKSKPDMTRTEFISLLSTQHPSGKTLSGDEQERAVNLVVKVLVMVNCSGQHPSISLLEHGEYQAVWQNEVTFAQFLESLCPMTDHPAVNERSSGTAKNIRKTLTAKNLKKRAGLTFRATDNISNHLRLDSRTGVVDIFHHTAFLKEHLRLTKDQSVGPSVLESLKHGAIPRQLALEILDSIQKILFPLDCHDELLSLTSKASFDPDCLRFTPSSIRNADEKDIKYHYFGSRLIDLYEEMEHPTPRGLIEKWLERKSGARYVMMATLIGVVIAVVLGMASLALGAYQAWVGYQQWQHPVSQSASS